jgi:hypothetical protein
MVLHSPVPSTGRALDDVDSFAADVRAVVAAGCGQEVAAGGRGGEVEA